MARVTVEDCIDKVESPYELVLVAKWVELQQLSLLCSYGGNKLDLGICALDTMKKSLRNIILD